MTLRKRSHKAFRSPTIELVPVTNVMDEVLVIYDLLERDPDFKPKFVETYVDGATMIQETCRAYVNEVRQGDSLPLSIALTGHLKNNEPI